MAINSVQHRYLCNNKLSIICMLQQDAPESSKGKPDSIKSLLRETKKTNKQLKQENKRLKKVIASNEKNLKEREKEKKENADLKILLKETKAVNTLLKKQNKRQKRIWSALQQFCKALGTNTGDGHQNMTMNNKKSKYRKEDKEGGHFYIHLISISSSKTWSSVEYKYNVSVKYTTKEKPGVQWIVIYNNVGDKYVTRGWTKYDKTNETYVSGIELGQPLLKFANYILVQLYCTSGTVEIGLNMSEIIKPQSNIIEYAPFTIAEKFEKVIVPKHDNFTVFFHIHGNLYAYDHVDAFVNGFDDSVYPPRVFEHLSLDNDGVYLEAKRITNSSSNVSVTVQQKPTEYAVILSLSLTRRSKLPRIYETISYRTEFELLSNTTNAFLRPGTIGIYPLENTTIVLPPFGSITCLAMGYERPIVSLVRETRRDVKEIPHDVFLQLDKYTTLKTFTIYTNDSEVEGSYKCMAASNMKNDVVTSETEVFKYEPTIIIDEETDIVTNTSDQIQIVCKATGKPLPDLELRLHDKYGPDLSRSPYFDTARSYNRDSWTSMITVTIEPVDRNYYKVYCTATTYGVQQYKEINIFPEPEF